MSLSYHSSQVRCPMSGLPETYDLSSEKDRAALRVIAEDGGCAVYVAKDPGSCEEGWVQIRNLRLSEAGKLCGDLE